MIDMDKTAVDRRFVEALTDACDLLAGLVEDYEHAQCSAYIGVRVSWTDDRFSEGRHDADAALRHAEEYLWDLLTEDHALAVLMEGVVGPLRMARIWMELGSPWEAQGFAKDAKKVIE